MISFLWGILEVVTEKGCLKKKVCLWNLLRKFLEGSAGKSKGDDCLKPKH